LHGNIRAILHGEAELVGTRLIVWDPKAGLEIYRSGFFGKPVGIPKPKPEQEFDVPLLLDLMEGLYLLEEGRITVVDSKTRRNVGRQVLLAAARRTYRGFELAYRVYRDLRDKGFIVTPGIKFGADFAVYERGPGIDHAPFIVSVETPESLMGPFEVVRAGRLATTVRKQFIIAIPDKKKGSSKVRYIVFRWFKA
jgi:tRNA-intron endonuclease, archaea type